MKTKLPMFLLFFITITSFAQTPDRQQFIRTEAKLIALTHVRVIDGTGAAAKDDQTVVISDGKVQSVEPSASAKIPTGAQTMDLTGYTVLPGLVGMHNHMFFPMGGSPPMYSNMGISFPRLYLANGVTTVRTTGSVQPYLDLEMKKLIRCGSHDWAEDAHHRALSRRPRFVHSGYAHAHQCVRGLKKKRSNVPQAAQICPCPAFRLRLPSARFPLREGPFLLPLI